THSSSADVRAPSWAEVGSSRSSVQPGSARARESASASSRRCRSPRESVATDVNGSKRRRRTGSSPRRPSRSQRTRSVRTGAARVGATEEEGRAEGRVGRKAGRTEAVDQRVGDDVDEDGAGHSGEQERAELPAPPQPEPVAEQDRPAFLAANGGGEERVAALL